MLGSLTKYLFHYRQVAIPHVGTVYLTTETAELKFIERLLMPPREKFRLRSDDAVKPHQLEFLMAAENLDADGVQHKLETVGKVIQTEMANGSFNWRGVGRFSGTVFIGADDNLLQPVPAQKVQRSNASHQVLVGDRHVMSPSRNIAAAPPDVSETHVQRPVPVLAWILLAAGTAVALWLLLDGKFEIGSFGLRLAP